MTASQIDAGDAHADVIQPPDRRTVAELPTVAPVLALAPTPVEVSSLRYHSWRRGLKRLTDVTFALLSLPLTLPLILIVALLVRCTSRGPALFRQQRVGQFGELFTVLKFRTMYHDAAKRLLDDPTLYAEYVANDFKLATGVDPRVTPVGRFLRKWSLDELPQLFNVLGGSMSLVGPRPIIREELRCYGDVVASYLQMRPGITGPWQVDGHRVRYPERAHLDHDYLVNWRLRTDLAIMARTVPSIVRRRKYL